MSNQNEHDARVCRNRDFYNKMDTMNYPEWGVVVLYYGVVHMVESVLARENIHTTTHEDRKTKMWDRKDLFPREIFGAYRGLETLSRQARYCPEFSISDEVVKKAQAEKDEIEAWYNSHKT